MSVEAMSWVFTSSEASGGDRLVLLALADHAGRDEWVAWPSVARLARSARLSPRAAQYALRRLERDGRIVRAGESRNRTVVWRVVKDPGIDRLEAPQADGEGAEPAGGAVLAGCNSRQVEGAIRDRLRVQPVAPEPSIEPPVEPVEEDRTRESELVAPLPVLPSAGDNVDELRAYLQCVADHVGDRFASAWFGDQDRVMRVIAAEQPAVRLVVCDYLCRQALAGWRTPGLALQVGGKIVDHARRVVDEQARTPGTTPARSSSSDQQNEFRRELMATIQGDSR